MVHEPRWLVVIETLPKILFPPRPPPATLPPCKHSKAGPPFSLLPSFFRILHWNAITQNIYISIPFHQPIFLGKFSLRWEIFRIQENNNRLKYIYIYLLSFFLQLFDFYWFVSENGINIKLIMKLAKMKFNSHSMRIHADLKLYNFHYLLFKSWKLEKNIFPNHCFTNEILTMIYLPRDTKKY